MKPIWLKLFSLALIVSLFVPSGTIAAPAQRIPETAPGVQGPGGGGGNPVVADRPASAPAALSKPAADPNQSVRVIVQLQDPPLASYRGGIAGLAATSPMATGRSKLDVNAPASQSYTAYLAGKQAALRQQLAQAAPGARIDQQYRVVLNGLAVKVRASQIAAIRALPGVKAVTPEHEYKLDMDASIPLIGLGTGTLGGAWTDSGLWAALGGHANAGAGIKVADIDTGNTPTHPCFDPAGYSYPAGFPKYDPGFAAYVTQKIIVARAFFRPDDPPVDPTPLDGITQGHGTHTAGTIGCNYGTQTPFSGIKISGVAPRAYLMNYRVFYLSISGSESAFTPELVAAIEAAVADGADVVNNSWGGLALTSLDDPEVAAYSAAVDAGLVIVFANGNDGPNPSTVEAPGIGSKFISVGASTTDRTFTATVSAISTTSPSLTIPVTVTNISGRSLISQTVTAPTLDLRAAGYTDTIACAGALPSSLVSGKIVVIERGTCALVDKVANAKAGNAVGVILRNVAGGATTLPLIQPVLPTVHVAQSDGDNIFHWLSLLRSKDITATFSLIGPAHEAFTDPPDTLASFSSLGPTPDLAIKPDLSAPGVNILSSVSYAPGFDFFQGTSMATPHVAGAAALLRQLHPTWTPAEIKSALMSTSAQPASLGSNPTERGAGRLNLTHPGDPGLTFDPPSLSFGLMTVGSTQTRTVTATNMSAAAGVYTVTAAASAGGFTPTVPATISVAANGMTSFKVELTAGAAGDAYGNIDLTDGTVTHTLHIPY